MEKDLVNIIVEKEFIELSSTELAEVNEFCSSEEEYNQMRDVFLEVESITFDTPKPKAETKKSLDNLFNQTYPKVPVAWYSSILTVVVPKDKPIHRQPILQVAAICLLFIMIIPFFNTDVAVQKNQIAEVEKLTDTEVGSVAKVKVIEKEEDNIVNGNQQESSIEELIEPEIEVPRVVSVENFNSSNSLSASTPFTAFSASFDHPDGIFDETIAEVDYSMNISELPDVLDLLTTTF